MSRILTVVKEADYRWNVIGEDGSIVCGPLKYKREAAVFVEMYYRVPNRLRKNSVQSCYQAGAVL